jgi:uncharacterized protein YkwD
MSGGSPRLALSTLVLVASFAATGALAVGPIANPEPVYAGTAETMEGYLVRWINSARVNRGIPALRVGSLLTSVAGYRASTMAKTGKLEHVSCLACLLRSWGVSFSRCGEVIAYTTWPWGYEAAHSIFRGWKGSTSHWSMLMSRDYTRFGVGVAYRSSNRSTWAAAVLAR